MPDVTPVETLRQYVMSNGSVVISNQDISYYTANEILKIEAAGGALVIAVLVLTYVGYAYAMRKLQEWRNQQELEEMIAAGVEPDMDTIPPLPPKPNRILLLAVGGFIMLAGIAMVILPS